MSGEIEVAPGIIIVDAERAQHLATADTAARLALELAAAKARIVELEDDHRHAQTMFAALIIEHGGQVSIPHSVLVSMDMGQVINRVDEHDHVRFWLTPRTD